MAKRVAMALFCKTLCIFFTTQLIGQVQSIDPTIGLNTIAGMELPTLQEILTQMPNKGTYELGCLSFKYSRADQKLIFEPDFTKCKGKSFISELVQKLMPSIKLNEMLSDAIPAAIFSVKYFEIDRKENKIFFISEASEPFELIDDSVTIEQGQLQFGMPLDTESISFKTINIDLSGRLSIGENAVSIKVKKEVNSDEFYIFSQIDGLSISDFTLLFNNAKIQPGNTPTTVNTVTHQPLNSVTLTGWKMEDGSFEIVIKGVALNSDIFKTGKAFGIVQRSTDEEPVFGLLVFVQQLSPASILTKLFKKDLSNVPFLKDLKVDFILKAASGDVLLSKDDDLNKVINGFSADEKAMCKGLTIDLNLPKDKLDPQAIVGVKKGISPQKVLSKIQEFVPIKIDLDLSKLSFKLPESYNVSLESLANGISPTISSYIPRGIFKEGKLPFVQIRKLEFDVEKGFIDVAVYCPSTVTLVTGVFELNNLFIHITHRGEGSPWNFHLQSSQKLFGCTLETDILKEDSNYIIKAQVLKLSTLDIMEYFAGDMAEGGMMKTFDFLDFGVKNFALEAIIKKQLSVKFKGQPILFGHSNAFMEGFIEKGAKESRVIFGLVLRKMRIDALIKKIIGKEIRGCMWLTELDIALSVVFQSDEKEKEKIAFESKELQNLSLEQGVILQTEFTLPDNCQSDALCEQIKDMIRSDARLLLKGKFSTSGVELRATYLGAVKISSLNITEVTLVITVGTSNSLYLEVVLNMKDPNLKFRGRLSIGVTGKVELNVKMQGMWNEPFKVQNLAIGNLGLGMGVQPGVPLPLLEMSGEINFGKPGSSKLIKAKGAFGFDPTDPFNDYFYASINHFSLGAIKDAFELDISLPDVLLEMGFPEGLTLSFAMSPKGKKLDHLGVTLKPGFSLCGKLVLFKLHLYCDINIQFPFKMEIEVKMSPLQFAKGLISLRRSLIDAENGPTFYAQLDLTSVAVHIQGYTALLGIGSEVDIEVSNKGLKFYLLGNLFNLIAVNATLKASYGSLENANFEVSACLSTAVDIISSAASNRLQNVAEHSEKLRDKATKKMDDAQGMFAFANQKIERFQKKLEKLERKMAKSCDKVEKVEGMIKTSCKEQCPKECKSGMKKKKKCKKVFGKWLPCLKWDDCKKMRPSRICIAKCKGRKITGKAKVRAKKLGVKILLKGLKAVKKLMAFGERLVKSAQVILDYASKGLKLIEKVSEIGRSIMNKISELGPKGLFKLHHLCFNTSLSAASGKCFYFSLNVTIMKTKNLDLNKYACIGPSLIKDLSKEILQKLFPKIEGMNDIVGKAKKLFSSAQVERSSLDKEIEVQAMKCSGGLDKCRHKELDKMMDEKSDSKENSGEKCNKEDAANTDDGGGSQPSPIPGGKMAKEENAEEEWVDFNGVDDEDAEFMKELASRKVVEHENHAANLPSESLELDDENEDDMDLGSDEDLGDGDDDDGCPVSRRENINDVKMEENDTNDSGDQLIKDERYKRFYKMAHSSSPRVTLKDAETMEIMDEDSHWEDTKNLLTDERSIDYTEEDEEKHDIASVVARSKCSAKADELKEVMNIGKAYVHFVFLWGDHMKKVSRSNENIITRSEMHSKNISDECTKSKCTEKEEEKAQFFLNLIRKKQKGYSTKQSSLLASYWNNEISSWQKRLEAISQSNKGIGVQPLVKKWFKILSIGKQKSKQYNTRRSLASAMQVAECLSNAFKATEQSGTFSQHKDIARNIANNLKLSQLAIRHYCKEP